MEQLADRSTANRLPPSTTTIEPPLLNAYAANQRPDLAANHIEYFDSDQTLGRNMEFDRR